jgi:hypothetical protein
MLIDTLLYYGPTTRTATREEILAELEPLGFARADEEDVLSLNGAVSMWVELVVQQAVYDNTDPESPVLVTPRSVLPGLAVWACSPAPNDALWNLPNGVARLEADRDVHAAGEPGWLLRARSSAELIASIAVEPSYAGANYPFG